MPAIRLITDLTLAMASGGNTTLYAMREQVRDRMVRLEGQITDPSIERAEYVLADTELFELEEVARLLTAS